MKEPLTIMLKRVYYSPEINVDNLILEHPIAAGSATVITVDANLEVRQEWDTSDDQSRELLW